MYLAMLGFWIVCYPVHFAIRRRLGGKNWIVPGLLATAVYCVQIVQPFLVEAELPMVADPEVAGLVKQIMEEDLQRGKVTLKDIAEVSFDAAAQKRVGRCTAVTRFGEEPARFTIDWQDRRSGRWQVLVNLGPGP